MKKVLLSKKFVDLSEKQLQDVDGGNFKRLSPFVKGFIDGYHEVMRIYRHR